MILTLPNSLYFTQIKPLILREGLFIKKNKDRWTKAQQELPEDPDQMASDFTKLVDDLAYAKTFYPSSKVTRYVNGLASRIYLTIYNNRKEESNRITDFWKRDLPLVILKHQGTILIMFLLFLLFFVIGFFSAKNDPGFVSAMLGEDYVRMTEQNIENGNPFGVYQSGNSFIVWLGIFANNTIVALGYFGKGLTLGIFTVTAMVQEAVRIGAFEEFFFAKGYGLTSVLTVLLHGTLELWSIIIAAVSGVVLPKSFLFPGTMKRFDSLKKGAREGVKLLIGIVPVLMMAAFIEGFITRYYRMHWAISSSILLLSASFIIWYFGLYPRQVGKKIKTGEGAL